jgi:hypothetical protein
MPTREKKLAGDLIPDAGRKKGESMGGQYCGRAARCHVTLLKADPNRFAERCGSARIGHPKDWVFRGLRIRMAAQVGEIDKADWCDIVLAHPVECRAEISAPAASRLKSHWL